MQITVLGAGVIGLTSAYYLSRAGHRVTVIDRHAEVASETSFGNGGQLSYSYVAPLAGPGVLSKLPVWLSRRDSPVRFKPSASPEQWRWCIEFALACTKNRSNLTTRRLLSLSFLSRTLMHELVREESTLDFDFSHSGKLVLHRDAHAMQSAVELLEFQRMLGCEQQALTSDECVSLEPALESVRAEIAGGIYTPSEDTADCHRFCKGLESLLRARGIRFEMNTSIDALRRTTRGRVEIVSGDIALDADQIVVAMGTGAQRLLKPLGLRLPIYPLKGYSLTYQLGPRAIAPKLSVTDFTRKVVYARFGDRLRVAGMADLDGYSLEPDPARVAALRAETASLFPFAATDATAASEWTGLRPATPRGAPIIGPTPYRNLWLNVGHGALGFTLATGSAALLVSWLNDVPDPALTENFRFSL
ncbi:D-amino acid dehydrogenase [Paraburkholderia silvatlantica]|uniref:D-amino acid dehydrogenase n=1 Tax=Paraburkholderia silvatlantica TaxID=321895 RepID=UPI00105E7C7A|nr:D-amino acid dehydrogenase [Paraburkholderia silvatlantica]TDQ89452.1 D-amino acid dehydrogenase small subunit [Paraburkholderia silvatlantica]